MDNCVLAGLDSSFKNQGFKPDRLVPETRHLELIPDIPHVNDARLASTDHLAENRAYVFHDGVNEPEKLNLNYIKQMKSLNITVLAGKNKEPYSGIFDTGAQSVCIQQDLAKKLELEPIGHANVSGATGTAKASLYRFECYLRFDNGELYVNDIVAWGVHMPGDLKFLIGQPVISLMDFRVEAFKNIQVRMLHPGRSFGKDMYGPDEWRKALKKGKVKHKYHLEDDGG